MEGINVETVLKYRNYI
jgi:hypothetical protein